MSSDVKANMTFEGWRMYLSESFIVCKITLHFFNIVISGKILTGYMDIHVVKALASNQIYIFKCNFTSVFESRRFSGISKHRSLSEHFWKLGHFLNMPL